MSSQGSSNIGANWAPRATTHIFERLGDASVTVETTGPLAFLWDCLIARSRLRPLRSKPGASLHSGGRAEPAPRSNHGAFRYPCFPDRAASSSPGSLPPSWPERF